MLESLEQLGSSVRNPNFHVFFGHAGTDLGKLRNSFHDYTWKDVRQVHGTKIIGPETSLAVEADGLWDDRPRQALLIKTADCLPVFVIGRHRVCALHAGWRGLVGEILLHGVRNLLVQGENSSDLAAYVGPHISWKNFEVGCDVAAQIESAFARLRDQRNFSRLVQPHDSPDKKRIDLSVLAGQQLEEAGVPRENIHWINPCTFSNPHLHSFRRDGDRSGRNLSFVTRLD